MNIAPKPEPRGNQSGQVEILEVKTSEGEEGVPKVHSTKPAGVLGPKAKLDGGFPLGSGLQPGHYVLAVSGGVDSMVLLDILRKRPGIRLTVAHFDHGIREDSHYDKAFVEKASKAHKLSFVHSKGELGPAASEAQARKARYAFLHNVKEASGARAIITAHHQDDVLETALLNLLRGTGRRGLTALKSTDGIIRPLLAYSKNRIKTYALDNKVNWREDSTNIDVRYRRNYIRQNVMTKLTAGERAQLRILLEDLTVLNNRLDLEIINMLHTQPAVDVIARDWFISLPHDIASEVLHQWLHLRNVTNLNRRRIEQLVVVLKTAKPNTVHDVNKDHKLLLTKKTAHIKHNVRS